MRFVRRSSLLMASACLWVMSAPAFAQQQTPPPATPPQQPPAGQQQQPPARPQQPPARPQQTPPATPPQQPRNPFETVTPTQPPAQQTPPGQNPLQTVRPTPGTQPAANGQIITEIDFRGARRTPADMLRTLIRTRVGDVYNEETLDRDFMILYNSGRFDDIRLESEPDPKGGIIIRWVVVERRVIRSIDYQGIHTVTVSEILDRFKERKVGLTVESQYDPNKIQRAAIVLKEFLSERGRQYATVDPVVEQIPPSSLKVTFNVNEGPKVKVGTITITGNKAKNSRWVLTGDEEPAPVRHSALDRFREHVRQDLRPGQTGRGQGAHPPGLYRCRIFPSHHPGRDRYHCAAQWQRLAPAPFEVQRAGHLRRYQAARGRGQPVSPARHEFRGRQTVPRARPGASATVRHGRGQRLLH